MSTIEVHKADAETFQTSELHPGFNLAFLDPPFNIGQDYLGYHDRRNLDDFESSIHDAIANTKSLMRHGGIIALHGPDDMADLYLRSARSLGMHRIEWVIWHYRFGMGGKLETKRQFTDSFCHCIIFMVGPQNHRWTFNGEAVAVESDRKAIYNDKRTRDGNGGMRVPSDVWGLPSDGPYWGRVQGTSRERMAGRPNQLPEVYLERLIKAYTNTGDHVYDPYGGTGTTAVVAQALDRNCVTLDITDHAVATIHERLKRGAIRITSSTTEPSDVTAIETDQEPEPSQSGESVLSPA
ncbi:hypothetical protein LOC67_23585 [Stieleria sp. JC731]|uniref:DNA-methyltransferase n=1 Tax=Pirellulaceae TaxID=2691357 RepID=UPI001E409C35|nr:DNA methyltransferase [Stieleria sp. JC731]MCC9603543.1 hypothetical protein [Stieleria sp. JC731]